MVICTRTLILTYKSRSWLKQMTCQSVFHHFQEGTLNMINKNNESNTPAKGSPNLHCREIKRENEKNYEKGRKISKSLTFYWRKTISKLAQIPHDYTLQC